MSIEERLGVDALAMLMMNFNGYYIEDYGELVSAHDRFEFFSDPKISELDINIATLRPQNYPRKSI